MESRAPLAVQVSDPGYGPAMDPRERQTSVVRIDVEPVTWAPLSPRPAAPGPLVFVDGVQQIEAWLSVSPAEGGPPLSGVAFAIAAGAVTAEGEAARLDDVRVRREVVTHGERLLLLPAVGAFRWDARTGAGGEPQALAERVADARRHLERDVAERWAAPDRLVVLDGRLSFLRDPRGPVIGAVKSHHAQYLEDEPAQVVGALRVGQRTPLFAIGDDRFSWYQRLPGVGESGWSGILRGEVARAFGLDTARRLADRATAALPRFAGRPHRDPRAPQNLMPVMAMEGRLRHRLGDRRLAFRALRIAAARAELEAAARPTLEVIAA
ncbi:MAG TPA: hypothetical protein VNT51_07550 [Miltoncostaeaceae bacterium]|nr:hypothetical protein [Miltoncostaeaceae bacterium]